MAPRQYTLPKRERISSQATLDALFRGSNSHGMVSFPLRLVGMTTPRKDPKEPSVEFMVSVPKRHFRHAVDRNRVKRQVRDAYRHAKHTAADAMERHAPCQTLHLAFLWLDSRHHTTADIARHVAQLIQRYTDRYISTPTPQQP